MRSLKEEECRLTMASKKDTMRRQLEMQRQKVQNLRGTTSVLISGSGTKTEKSKSKVPVSHEISSGREWVQNLLPIVVKELRMPFHLSCFKLVFAYSITLTI